MSRPEPRYARSGDLNIAYQVVGEGPFDLVYVHGWVSNVDLMWDEPSYARFLGRLASFSRLILFDKRGTGLSDPVPFEELPTLEQREDRVREIAETERTWADPEIARTLAPSRAEDADLVAGSGISFEDRGEHALKGVPGTSRVYAVARP